MISGIEFAGISSGIKPSGLDLGLVFFREGMNVFTLYTRNKVKAAHILYNKKMGARPIRALLVNSGCANACTGKEGTDDLSAVAGQLAPLLKIRPAELLFASTGVIGKRLPADTIIRSLPLLAQNLKDTHIDVFSRAIMTTDTYPKVIKETFRGKKEYSVIGVAKGSGMINPLFATMLAFVFTDYPVPPAALKRSFVHSVKESFERITVDGECSTNDTVMLFTKRGPEDPRGIAGFKEALLSVMQNLSMMIVKDGEGATRVAHIIVNGAKKKEIAEKIARRIAISPLTKTAFFGCDPNWGRIIAAAGDADVPVAPSKIDIILQGEQIVKNGVEVPFDEQTLKKMMNKKDISVIVNLNDGKASFDIYTTDLTYDYIKINASYRT
ncbi:MAG: bifunctional glutamate N-acetyltransferase/amino-acid acetyltransferase ArgJ [Syntrophorhabdaceae bacterium]|nr:bifunctional glutamate N-acetyltransferase/amino-acid acetyltransferase ArgJ [Syntrophorhabdaceae bacterium]MDD5244228.1 bifunctional glutamate N-acetyltransferase/amino-acid acetyltransferase ArgJ [Syntrophorhabdaceae bacterium]